ncbi:hypothetical protein BSKO_04658 [Bryopsis sp. KO-2023]|nr:hypothetical protein BSKO_04658 [Bryopsis sp. KO-2023]
MAHPRLQEGREPTRTLPLSTSGTAEPNGSANGPRLDLERDFWKRRERETLIVCDELTAGFGVLGFLGLYVLGTGAGVPVGMGVALMTALEISMASSREWYLRRRSRILVPTRIAFAYLYGLAGSAVRLQGDVSPLADTLMMGTWPSLVGGALGMQLPFGRHIAVQTVASLLSSSFPGRLCEGSFGGDAYRQLFRNFESRVDALGSTLVLLSAQGTEDALIRATTPAKDCCWVVLNFWNLWLGWVLPTLALWFVERRARIFYLARLRLASRGNFRLPSANLLARAVWCFNLLVFFEVSWRSLKSV